MKPPIIIFILAVGMALVLLAAFRTPEPENGRGIAHPEIEHLRQGGDGAERHEPTIWIGLVYGLIQIGFFIACLGLGTKRAEGSHPLRVPMIIGTLLFMGVWCALVFSYRHYMQTGDDTLFGGFPRPTAWMLFGIWPVPLFFVAMFLLAFEGHVYNKESQRKFEETMKQYQETHPPEREG